MTPGEKYSVKISDEQIASYVETFKMFDKVRKDHFNKIKLEVDKKGKVKPNFACDSVST